jgi:hypothetical protein
VALFPPSLYIDNLIDDFGIWQHSDGKVILREEGYALDDAARGLLFTLAQGRTDQSEVLFSYLEKSQSKDGVLGFSDANRHFLPKFASSDAIGQTIWAAGYAISKNFHVTESKKIVTGLAANLDKTKNVRGFAYALLGLVYVDDELARHFCHKLLSFFDNVDDDWPWPDPALTYGNGIIPYAFFRYALVFGDKQLTEVGTKILFFLEASCTHNRQRGPIGNNGWHPRGVNVVPKYSQQPIDAAYMIWAWLAYFQLTGDLSAKENAKAWMGWFEGHNIANTRMYDPKDMRCFDGIDSIGVHYNSGAESNICLLLSKYMLAENKTI